MPIRSRDVIDADDPRVARFGHPAPPWLVNYADLMTELCCFFIIMYALTAALSKKIMGAKGEIEEAMEKAGIAIETEVTKEGLRITIQEKGPEKGGRIFFETGKATLTPEMKNVLDEIAPILRKLVPKNDIIVEGHTDNVPIYRPPFYSNWELSTARAVNVVKYLIHEKGFPPESLSAIGYGEYKPCASNDTEEGRAKNRRVVFFVKTKPPKFKGE